MTDKCLLVSAFMQSPQHPVCSICSPVPNPITSYMRASLSLLSGIYISTLNSIIFQSAFISPSTFSSFGQFTSFLSSVEEVSELSVLIDLGVARPLKTKEKKKQWWELWLSNQVSIFNKLLIIKTPSLRFEIWFHHNARMKTFNLL